MDCSDGHACCPRCCGLSHAGSRAPIPNRTRLEPRSHDHVILAKRHQNWTKRSATPRLGCPGCPAEMGQIMNLKSLHRHAGQSLVKNLTAFGVKLPQTFLSDELISGRIAGLRLTVCVCTTGRLKTLECGVLSQLSGESFDPAVHRLSQTPVASLQGD